jgi:hypothetical protein
MGARLFHVHVKGLFRTKYRFFKTERHAGFDVTAASLLLPAPGAAAEELAENISQSAVAEIKLDILPKTSETFKRVTGTGSAANSRMAELVVALALLLVFKDFIGFAQFFELSLITPVFIGVVFDRQTAVRFFDFVGTGGLRDTQDLVIIALTHLFI